MIRSLWCLWLASVVAPGVQAASPPKNAQPSSFLKIGSLSVTAGQPFNVELNLPTGETWQQANIGQFILRSVTIQESIAAQPIAGGGAISITPPDPGYALLVLGAGPAAEKGKPDSWQRTPYCVKYFLRVAPDPNNPQQVGSQGGDPGLTGKVGQKIELRPYISPVTLRVGSDLPVRAYYESGSQKNAKVVAFAPDGSRTERTTGPNGYAVFPITQHGRWLVRFEKTVDGMKYTGDLVFEVPNDKPADRGGQGK